MTLKLLRQQTPFPILPSTQVNLSCGGCLVSASDNGDTPFPFLPSPQVNLSCGGCLVRARLQNTPPLQRARSCAWHCAWPAEASHTVPS
ncbi:cytochrome c oxidase assembly protein COX16 homolog, mitochondrial isoform X2 [Pleurodeles waltl]|uniref:cytochrome c oxidase assembly protein COX16 homolog, mitochondrial isoform X2 n=1 Tax=Pleurodeles waltl TaxID=8319 RepID=UPI0037095489